MTKINQKEYEILKGLDDKWKWIVRGSSYGGSIFCFREKPHKDIRNDDWGPDTTQFKYLGEYDLLFQFIQWEDEEPYNIAELIEEYEEHEFYDYVGWEYHKNEETEMKKDILWAKIKIHEELDSWCGVEGGIDGDGINNVLNILDQLDEPETLSQEWIDENKKYTNIHDIGYYIPVNKLYGKIVSNKEEADQAYKDGYDKGIELMEVMNMVYEDGEFWENERMSDLQNLLVPKQGLPTIPEFVAEFLDGKEDYMLHELLDDEWLYSKHDQIAKWLYDNDEKTNREREFNLVLAHIYDYEVEAEQKYYVMNNDQRMMLVRMMDGKTITEADPFRLEDMYEGEKESHRLTEQEIKGYDPRYWAFRKPVEELEKWK